MTSEKSFETQVKKWLNSQGIYNAGTPDQEQDKPIKGWFFKVWGGGYQKSGIPDIIIMVNGFALGCELKRQTGGKLSPLQDKNIKMINKSNGIGIILKPNGFEDFKKIVKELINCDTHIQWLTALKNAHSNSNCLISTE